MGPLRLPPGVVSRFDIARLMREVNGLNDFFVAANSRQPGTTMQLPKLTRMLDELVRENNANLLDPKHRALLVASLKLIYEKAPSFHISFAVEPSPKSLEKILIWLRRNIHPQITLQVGLQPTIAAGCILRTTNKIFDMSLRSRMNSQTEYLQTLIRGAVDAR